MTMSEFVEQRISQFLDETKSEVVRVKNPVLDTAIRSILWKPEPTKISSGDPVADKIFTF
jgi:hypothetical protein